MGKPTTNNADVLRLQLFLSPPHECGYLPEREAATLFTDPAIPMDSVLYEQLLERGFRRSSHHIYRAYCSGCNACVSVRLPVARFRPSRSLRRVIKRNGDLTVTRCPAQYDADHFSLYRRYLAARHAGGPMDDPSKRDYLDFLTSHWADTLFYAFHKGEQLLMVAVADHQPRGLSAVYTFYDPEHAARSLGTYAILWQIEETLRKGKPWLYLGYWIENCRKMAYKARFRPLEAYIDRRWQPLPRGECDTAQPLRQTHGAP